MASPSKARPLEENDLPQWHVVPVGDLKEHDNSPDCWCRPWLDPCADGMLYVHNSLDGRERELN